MKKLNPFFVIGSVGIALTGMLHMVFALILAMPFVHNTFWVLYPSFFAFMVIGTAQMIGTQLKPLQKKADRD